MTQTREVYRVVPGPGGELIRQLNIILQRIADRLDKMEGLRGDPKFYSSTFDFASAISGYLAANSDTQASFGTVSGNVGVHNHTASDQGGDLAAGDITAAMVAILTALLNNTYNISIEDSNGETIHQLQVGS